MDAREYFLLFQNIKNFLKQEFKHIFFKLDQTMFYTVCRQCKNFTELADLFQLADDCAGNIQELTKHQCMQGLLFGLVAIERIRTQHSVTREIKIHPNHSVAKSKDQHIHESKDQYIEESEDEIHDNFVKIQDFFHTRYQESIDLDWIATLIYGKHPKIQDQKIINSFWKLLSSDNLNSAPSLCAHIFFLCIYAQRYHLIYDVMDHVRQLSLSKSSTFFVTCQQYLQREFLSLEGREFGQKCLTSISGRTATEKKTNCRQEYMFDDQNITNLMTYI